MHVAEGVVCLTKEFNKPSKAVFGAWADEQAQLTWSDPGPGWSMTFDSFRFAVGQSDVCRFGPVGGQQYLNENRYLAIEPAQRIIYSTSLSSDGRINFAGTVVVTFEATGNGTRMVLTEQGLYFDGNDDVEGHRSGWEGMLAALGKYLED